MLTGTNLLIRDLREERNRAVAESNELRAALRRIEKHHVDQCRLRLLPVESCVTVQLVREVLPAFQPEPFGGEE